MRHRPGMNLLASLCVLSLLALCATDTVGSEITSESSRVLCTETGLFPVQGSCHYYYECQYLEDLFPILWSCPSGKIFNEDSKECSTPSSLNILSQCGADSGDLSSAVVPSTAGDRELNHSNGRPTFGTTEKEPLDGPEGSIAVPDNTRVTGTNDGETSLSINEMTICEHISIIDSYSTLLISNAFYQVPIEHLEKYNVIAMNYNRDLEVARNNTHLWRNGDSILLGIKKTYQLATQYEVEFNQKYEIYQKRIMKTILEQGVDKAFIQILQDDITRMKEEIKETEEALKLTDQSQLIGYFENSISFKKQEIERKQQEINGSSEAALQLEELSYFIETVQKDAHAIENIARTSKDRVKMLYSHFEEASNTFESGVPKAKEDIHALEEEIKQHDQSLKTNLNQQEKLENEKQEMYAKHQLVMDNNSIIMEEIKNLMDVIDAKIEKYNQERAVKCNNGTFFSYIFPANAEKKCKEYLERENIHLDIGEENKKCEQLNMEIDKNNEQMKLISSQITSKNQEITNLRKTLPSPDDKTLSVAEIIKLQLIVTDLENLQVAINGSLESAEEITKELQKVESYFREIVRQFTDMIASINIAQSNEDKLKEKAAIELDLSSIETQIKQPFHQLSQQGKCV